MSSFIIKKRNTTLVLEKTGDLYLESNYSSDYQEMHIELDNNELNRLYNSIGKILGYPEVKEVQNVQR